MRKQIIFSLLGMILLLGAVYAGGLAISQRQITLTTAQTTALTSKGINDVASSKLNCKEDYCTFWISKEGVINSERRIEKYKEVCTEEIIDVKPEDCEKEEGRLDEKKLCYKTICNDIAKTEEELLSERATISDDAIKSIADEIIVVSSKTPSKVEIGTDEEILIGVKPK